jgi:type I restriction-modification system DNA methylase subunit
MAKRSRDYGAPDGKEVWKELEKISAWGYGYDRIFSDFLDLTLNSLLSLTENMGKPDLMERLKENRLDDEYNARYLEIVGRYKENKDRPHGQRPIDYFCNAWGVLQMETRQKQQDILGEIFTDRITYGEHGQFFTPAHVTDLIAKLVAGEAKNESETVHDPCCGSGRFLLSMAKQKPNSLLYGQDIDLRCVKMTALNLWMFDLDGIVKCGDSLHNKWSVAYEVRRGGYVYERLPTKEIIGQTLEMEKPAQTEDQTLERQVSEEPSQEKQTGLEKQMRLEF